MKVSDRVSSKSQASLKSNPLPIDGLGLIYYHRKLPIIVSRKFAIRRLSLLLSLVKACHHVEENLWEEIGDL